MNHEHLQISECVIVPFPVDRETAFVRETARILTIRTGASAERFWQMTQRRLLARLQVQRIPDQEIKSQIDNFVRAVASEMQKQSANPRGAA
ncbi:MAG TPA: DUF6074 family protein [Ensifer sp.]|nr:DUF6074 family protein [Ensifer sp.]